MRDDTQICSGHRRAVYIGNAYNDASILVVPTETLCKGDNPCMRVRYRCIAYTAFIYVTVSVFNALNVFAVVQRGRDINLIISFVYHLI